MKVVQSKSDTGYLNLYFPACGTMLTLLYVISYFGIIACMSKVVFFLDLILMQNPTMFNPFFSGAVDRS